MTEPENRRHGNGDRNDNDVAKKDRPGQKERDRKIRQGEKDVGKESRRNMGAD